MFWLEECVKMVWWWCRHKKVYEILAPFALLWSPTKKEKPRLFFCCLVFSLSWCFHWGLHFSSFSSSWLVYFFFLSYFEWIFFRILSKSNRHKSVSTSLSWTTGFSDDNEWEEKMKQKSNNVIVISLYTSNMKERKKGSRFIFFPFRSSLFHCHLISLMALSHLFYKSFFSPCHVRSKPSQTKRKNLSNPADKKKLGERERPPFLECSVLYRDDDGSSMVKNRLNLLFLYQSQYSRLMHWIEQQILLKIVLMV